MTIDEKIRDKKVQYDINREAAKISALSFGKIDKYEYFIGEKTLAFVLCSVTEQAKFTCSTLGKAFEKQIKTTENQGGKQIKEIEEHANQLTKSNALTKNMIRIPKKIAHHF